MNYLKNCPNCSTTLRFPASQGTVLVSCPVCSHRFQFDSLIDSDFRKESSKPFEFQPSKQEYYNLFIDLLYAPIDFIKTKFEAKRNNTRNGLRFWQRPKIVIELLLFGILFLYFVRGLQTKPDTNVSTPPPEQQEHSPIDSLDPKDPTPNLPPIDPREPSIDI